MLNRRLIRIKVLQGIYAYHQSENKSQKTSILFIDKSVKGIENTFIDLLQFSFDFFYYVDLKFVNADKYLKQSKTNISKKNLILSKNLFLDILKRNKQIEILLNRTAHNWNKEHDFLFSIYKKIDEEEWFKKFEESNTENIENDKNLILEFYRFLITKSDDFNSKMEEITIHWQDEKIPLLNSFEKLINSVDLKTGKVEIPLVSKNMDEDIEFAHKLFNFTIKNQDKFEKLIASQTPDWETERIARIDLYIMTMALSEFTEFENIPIKVTLNEYLELAKIYSTPQSSKFVNGILDKLHTVLKKNGEIVKKGRGLVEN
ncbi:MAG: transcription antitermination factor NusB [Bacteroidia bacterium]|nr:transcription antitermination factor NusB [Bacteroidia bacterium]